MRGPLLVPRRITLSERWTIVAFLLFKQILLSRCSFKQIIFFIFIQSRPGTQVGTALCILPENSYSEAQQEKERLQHASKAHGKRNAKENAKENAKQNAKRHNTKSTAEAVLFIRMVLFLSAL